MDGFDPDDPINDFVEDVHIGRRFPLCCSTVVLQYDSSTRGECLFHSFAMQKVSNLFIKIEFNPVRFHGPDWTNYPSNVTTNTKEHTN